MSVPLPLPPSRRRALLAAPSVRVWTVQSVESVRRACTLGRLSGGQGECPCPEDDPTGRRAYGWMRRKMEERLPAYSGEWPVWVWAKRPSWRHPRPGHVLLSALVPSRRVLWSDYDLWHAPLNGSAIVADEAAWDAWESGGGDMSAAEASWDACLDILRVCPGGWSGATGMVQGCCDGIAWNEIVHVARRGAALVGCAVGTRGKRETGRAS